MSDGTIVGISLCKVTGGSDRPWLIFIDSPRGGSYSLPYAWRTKAEAMPVFRKLRSKMRSSVHAAKFAADEANAYIRQMDDATPARNDSWTNQ